jgi:PLP dependent protein
MSNIADNTRSLLLKLPPSVTLVAVSKTYPAEAVMECYAAGQRDFGENRVQELVAKHAALPKDIRWHLIGHLQRNKVKAIAPFVHLIHSIDSLRLLQEVNKEAAANNRVIDVLLQFHIAMEETKFGFSMEEAEAMLSGPEYALCHHVRVAGVMGMASFTDDRAKVLAEFNGLHALFGQLRQKHFAANDHFSTISMGMSSDWPLAIEAGSNMIRVGSALFGARH